MKIISASCVCRRLFCYFDKNQGIKQYTYHKKERLKKRTDIDLLFKEGKTFGAYPFRVYYRLIPRVAPLAPAPPIPVLQGGVSVSKKHFKRAVDRNRIKRLMREAYRLQKGGLVLALQEKPISLHLFFIYTGKELPAFTAVMTTMQTVLLRLGKEIERS